MPRPTLEQLKVMKNLSVYPEADELLGIMVSGQNPDGTGFRLPVEGIPQGADWHLQASADNAAVVLTRTAQAAGSVNQLTAVEASFSAAPAAAVLLSVESPSGAVIARKILTGAMGTDLQYAIPLKVAPDAAIVVRLAAGGLGVIGHLSAHGFTA